MRFNKVTNADALKLAVIGWSYLAISLAIKVSKARTPRTCIFLIVTGRPCCLCGMTRAFGCVMVGDIDGAKRVNRYSLLGFSAWLGMCVLSVTFLERNEQLWTGAPET
jgi:hypothetical protein